MCRFVVVGCLLAIARLANAQPAKDDAWRLRDALGLPSWLSVGLDQTTRFEQMANDYRAGTEDDDETALSLRTLVKVDISKGRWLGGLELEDSRTYASDATAFNTTLVDPLDVLQAYAGIQTRNASARAGRITIDLGTRRLVARNRFRNTINGFTGADAQWTTPNRHVARGFVAVPVTRSPSDPEALREHDFELDKENRDSLLWGTYYGTPTMWRGTKLELFLVGFHERDGSIETRNRQLLTGSARWYRGRAVGRFIDFDIEVMPQVGRSRATNAVEDTMNLDHRALSTHAELGINPAIAWRPRIAALHDYASGDGDPDDTTAGRFDPLFGARRFDFGPTGIYGPFNRSNLHSVGLRMAAAPRKALELTATYRLCWLASSRDAWPTANLRDNTGDSGSFLGEHYDVQLRWALHGNFALDSGAAYFRRGRFARDVAMSRDAAAAYFYLQLTTTL